VEDPTNPSSEAAAAHRALIEGARCAEHPELPAHAVCARCGNFMCATCSLQGRSSVCAACRGRVGGAASFPFSRERYTIGGLIEYAWQRFKLHWLTLSLCALVFLAVIYGIAFVGALAGTLVGSLAASDPSQVATLTVGIQVIMQIVQVAVQMWLQLGLIHVVLEVLQDRDVELGAMFSHARRLPPALGQILLIYLGFIVVIGPIGAAGYLFAGSDTEKAFMYGFGASAVALIPLMYFMLGMAFAMIELVYNPAAGAIEAMRTSFALVDGHRWPLIGTAIISGLVVMGGVLACCIGMIPAMAFSTLIYCSLFLALRTSEAAR
jgi:hypothetical protein